MPVYTHRSAGREAGFTLIELLVVILIIGILAAVAIPTFLSQPGKAGDVNVESTLTTIRTAESTYATGNGGSYTTSLSTLQGIEPSLSQPDSAYSVQVAFNTNATTGYTATATSPKTGTSFSLSYTATGSQAGQVSRTCTQPGVGTCPTGGIWGG